MLQIIIFSFNRAMQLNTLLNSMIRDIEAKDYTIDVLYNVSSDVFNQGYEKLKQDYQSYQHIHFIKETTVSKLLAIPEVFHASCKKEYKYFLKTFLKKKKKTNFRKALLRLLTENQAANVMFLTDDACFIEKTTIGNDITEWINADPYSHQFSLRTGKGMNEEPQGIQTVGNYLEWKYFNYEFFTLWGYLFSVDAHIYNKEAIVKALRHCYFDNPNSLESYVSVFAQKKKHFGTGRAFTKTRLLSFPINIVQHVADNKSLNISVETLNDYYLKGYTLEYPLPDHITTFQVYPKRLTLNHPTKERVVLTT